MLSRFCTAIIGRKIMITALFSFIIFMASTTGSVSAIESEFNDVMNERGKYSCLSSEEVELLELVNGYRQSNGLPAIPNSRSLNKVARIHVLDLYINGPSDSKDINGEPCNLHSWSYNGFWTPVCFTKDTSPEPMWNKSKEITNYVYFQPIYENAYWASIEDGIPSLAMNAWKKSPKHNALILETAGWKGENFQAIGIAIHKGFAALWVGGAIDTLGSMDACITNAKKE